MTITYVIRAIPLKLLNLINYIIILVKRDNLRLRVTIDFNRSMVVEKIITHRKSPRRLRKWTRENFGVGIGIGQYKPSGLRD